MLTADELTGMRETQALALPDTATITRPTRVSDGAGGFTTTPATVATAACRAARSRPREILGGEREVTLADWTLTFPYGTDVQAGDTVTSSGRTFQVIGILAGSWETARRAYCVGIEGA